MSKPYKCPVCEGEGKVLDVDVAGWRPWKTCHGCNGKGWVHGAGTAPDPTAVPAPPPGTPLPRYEIDMPGPPDTYFVGVTP